MNSKHSTKICALMVRLTFRDKDVLFLRILREMMPELC